MGCYCYFAWLLVFGFGWCKCFDFIAAGRFDLLTHLVWFVWFGLLTLGACGWLIDLVVFDFGVGVCW